MSFSSISILKISFGILAIVTMVYTNTLDINLLLNASKNNFLPIFFGFIIYILHTSLAGLRWFFLMRAAGIVITFAESFRIHMIGIFFSLFIPSGAGGDVAKSYYVYKNVSGNPGLAITSIFIDRVIGIYALLVVAVISILISGSNYADTFDVYWYSWLYISLLAAVTIIIIFSISNVAKLLFNMKCFKSLPFHSVFIKFLDALQVYRNKIIPLFVCFLFSIVIHALMIVVFYLSAISLGETIPISLHAIIVPLLLLVTLVPLTPGGIGVGEVAAFTLYGFSGEDVGGEIFLLFHAFMLVNAIIAFPFYLKMKNK